ncbi:MAG: hypothetical protein F4Z65_03695 [Acidobacteria bacterium]|nr:hypothetical protein [Acidobacteriota bacterium]MYA47038.1 hypothetical protein [Acidobacteriota bacterium]MYI39051.1 hypothetical protein [Acidobacteriota bacterium]
MNYTQQIIQSFKASSVERILVIDDAYDPPPLDARSGGALLDILSAAELRDRVSTDVLSDEVREAAIEALNNDELDDGAVSDSAAALYHVFVERRGGAFDPGGAFAAAKGSALEALDPLLELLHCCSDEPRVVTVGTGDAARVSRDLDPDLIFMDFYLSPPERTTKDITSAQWAGDRKRSIALLKAILTDLANNVPAVVLMSSEEVADRKEAYFGRLDDRVMALRFGFLLKRWVQGRGQELTASGDAAEVLLDTSGSFEFGRVLETALKAWKVGAEAARKALYSELREFDVQDFAYLLRFRIYKEGEVFADYLEWFLGESLRAIIDDKVDWTTDEFTRLNDSTLTHAIEGANPRPSARLAEFFHRMRFNSRRTRPRRRFALGDLFISSNRRSVRMVVSPECDLVPRGGSPAASRFLTIGGNIRAFHEDGALAVDLIIHDTPKAIKWNYKDLMTHDFGGASTLRVNGSLYSYFASMRPMPAQTIQKALLADLSRVGVAAPPTVDLGAPVRVYLTKNVGNQAKTEELVGFGEEQAQVFMPRGGNDKRRRVLFTSRFFRELLARLQEVAEDDLSDIHRGNWKACLAHPEKVRTAMLHDGLELPGESKFKLATSIGTPKGKSWLEIVVDISEGALISAYGTDLLEQ